MTALSYVCEYSRYQGGFFHKIGGYDEDRTRLNLLDRQM